MFTERQQIPNSLYPEHTLILQMNHLFHRAVCEGDKAQSELHVNISLKHLSNLCACGNVFAPRMTDRIQNVHFSTRGPLKRCRFTLGGRQIAAGSFLFSQPPTSQGYTCTGSQRTHVGTPELQTRTALAPRMLTCSDKLHTWVGL